MDNAINFGLGAVEAGLPVMIADIIKGNLAIKPQKQNDFNVLNGNIYIMATDAGIDMTMAFEKGNLTVHSGKVGNHKISISADSATLLDLANVDFKFGLPYLFDDVGKGIVKKFLNSQLKLEGLLTHPVMLTKFAKLMSVK